MPTPSSVTRIRLRPPAWISTATRVARASSAFSTNSFTTLAGRSTTSPAAIWFATCSGSKRMRFIVDPTGLLGQRKREREDRAATRLAAGPNAAAMVFDDFFADGKPEPGAVHFPVSGECFKQPSGNFGRDTRTGVFYFG